LLLESLVLGVTEAHSSGVILVQISSFLNPEGRDAAGTCCSRDGGRGQGGTCSAPCYTMFRICANRVLNDSVVVLHSSPEKVHHFQTINLGGTKEKGVEDAYVDRTEIVSDFNREEILSRNPKLPSVSGNVRVPPERPQVRPQQPLVRPQQPLVRPQQPPVRPQQSPNWPPLPPARPQQSPSRPRPGPPARPGFNKRPQYARPGPSGRPKRPQEPARRPPRPLRPQERPQRVQGPERRDAPSIFNFWRQDRSLFNPTEQCSYGSIETNVLFNNSLQGPGSLLVKIPFQETWDGLFSLSIEAWHVSNPKTIPQPPKEAKEVKSIFETLFSTFASLAKSKLKEVVQQEAEKKKSAEKTLENKTSAEEGSGEGSGDGSGEGSGEGSGDGSEDGSGDGSGDGTISEGWGGGNTDNSTEIPASTEIPTEENDNVEEDESESNQEEEDDFLNERKLVLRLERTHLMYAGQNWESNHFTTYHARIDYAVKLACAHNFTGESCSFAKICHDPKLKNHRRMYCTPEGEVVCREGWTGETCNTPRCKPGCHNKNGYCEKPGECKCRTGFTGPTCQNCIKFPGCLHGTCTKGYQCICKEGYTGLRCSTPVCSPGCNGYCKVPGTCLCRSGWTGSNCTECVPLRGCTHGTCNKPNQCICSTQYTGKYCDEPRCSSECSSENGYCSKPGECLCSVGWKGPQCTECVKYPGCLNGDCLKPWECTCRKGWRGATCSELDPEAAPGDGEELRGRCLPASGFRCMNGGSDMCTYTGNGTVHGEPACSCTDMYYGKYCQHPVQLGTVQNGTRDVQAGSSVHLHRKKNEKDKS